MSKNNKIHLANIRLIIEILGTGTALARKVGSTVSYISRHTSYASPKPIPITLITKCEDAFSMPRGFLDIEREESVLKLYISNLSSASTENTLIDLNDISVISLPNTPNNIVTLYKKTFTHSFSQGDVVIATKDGQVSAYETVSVKHLDSLFFVDISQGASKELLTTEDIEILGIKLKEIDFETGIKE